MTELKITSERVLAAAKKCSEAKEVLKELFPEAFEKDIEGMLKQGEKKRLIEFVDMELSYDVFKKIEGDDREEKAITILELLKKTYL